MPTGYLTVNEEHHSNLFFWFFPAEGTEHLYEEDKIDDNEEADYGRFRQLNDTNPFRSDDSRPVVLV